MKEKLKMSKYAIKDSSKYNTRVRQAISDECVRCSKEMQSVRLKIVEVSDRLVHGKNTLSYSDYLDLEACKRNLINQLAELQVESNTWDKAREICLNIADEGV